MQRQKHKTEDPYQLLWSAVCSGTADDIIRQANRLFGLPVLFVDEFFHVNAMYPAGGFGSREWDEISARKAMDREQAWALLDEFTAGDTRLYKPFFANTGRCAAQPKLFGELVREGTVLGHVIVYWYGGPPSAADYALMKMVLDSLGAKLAGRGAGISRWNMTLTAKLQDLLDPATPPRVKALAVEGMEASMKPEYVVLAAPVGELASHRAFGEYAVYQLGQSWRNTVSVVQDNAVVTLVGEQRRPAGTGNMRPDTGGLLGQLLEYFESHNLICGVSNCFTDPALLRAHYRQALLTAQLAVEEGAAHSAVFMDQMPRPLFQSLKAYDPPETFVHPAIYQIQAYDRHNGTAYAQTLRAYSLSMHDRDRTATRLSIHRNTLLYRLNRIAELFDLPYEDEAVALNLLCSFLILRQGDL